MMSFSHRLGTCVTLVIILLVCIVLVSVNSGAHAATPPTQSSSASTQATGLVQEQFPGWGYAASETNGQVRVVVSYDKGTRSGIEAFAQANRQLLPQVRGAIKVSVVFTRPLTLDEFREVTNKSGIRVTDYTMRAVQGDGTRVTLFGRLPPRANGIVTQDIDQAITAGLQHTHGATFKRVISVDGIADQTQLNQLALDKRVYVTDVTQSIAADYARAKMASRGAVVMNAPVESQLIGPLYWFMENTGIAPV